MRSIYSASHSTARTTTAAFGYAKKTLLSFGILFVVFVIQSVAVSPTASALTPPDSCFAFDSPTNTITNYYDTEADNPSSPACPRNVDIPSSIGGAIVTTLANDSFSLKQLTAATIPSTVVIVGDNAFAGNLIVTLSLPNTVTSWGGGVYAYNQIAAVTIPASMTDIPAQFFFYNNLTALTVPGHVATIGQEAFAFNSISSLTMQEGVTSVGKGAFTANQLHAVTVPSSLQSLYAYPMPPVQFGDGGQELTYSIFGPQGSSLKDFQDNVVLRQYLKIGRLVQDNSAWCHDPSVEAVRSEAWLVSVSTANPTNPRGFTDYVDIATVDGQTCDFVVGGFIINPAPVTMRFVDQGGSALRADEVQTGKTPGGVILRDYTANTSALPLVRPAIGETPTAGELAAMRDVLSSFYRSGQTFTYTAPVINGITPNPASYSFVLGANNTVNTKTFVYGAATGASLAQTGSSLTQLLFGALLLLSASMSCWYAVWRARRNA